ncbi:transcriptional repressor CTCF-like isoform X16 [Euwallacea similis]|uniref:transcriptional repressor CTCF-like isoform X16 n=1 Tax=Euwallacea similis TaxID=1736056 RepID=UPI00344F7038
MDNPGEILRLCRLCLVKDQVNIPIFEEQGDIRQTFLKIRSCLPVKVSRDDKLPKKICGGCSNKLDLFYEFWSSTANSEKTLQSWLGQEEEDDKMQEITKPVEALVKEESEALEDGHAHDQSFDEATKDEAEAPPAKRARRTAAVKAQINISHDSDEDEDVDGAEPITKIEDESDDSDGEEKDPSYTEVPGTSADDQAGPSGLGKDGVEAPRQVPMSRRPKRFSNEQNITITDLKIKVINFLCQYCNINFKNERDLCKHMKKHRIEDTQCKVCDKVFKNARILKAHVRNIHLMPRTKFECCGVVYVVQEKYKAHRDKYHNDRFDRLQDKTFKCKICNKIVQSYQTVLDHINTKHTKYSTYRCNICSNSYHSSSVLKNHMRRHDKPQVNLIKVTYACGKCQKEYSTAESLEAHNITSHTEHYDKTAEGKFQCKYCPKLVVAKISIEEHLNFAHLNDKKWICFKCGKNCYSQISLKRHEVVHEEKRDLKCEKCHKCFRNSEHLKIHWKSVHESLVTCSGDGSGSREELIKHMNDIPPDQNEIETLVVEELENSEDTAAERVENVIAAEEDPEVVFERMENNVDFHASEQNVASLDIDSVGFLNTDINGTFLNPSLIDVTEGSNEDQGTITIFLA